MTNTRLVICVLPKYLSAPRPAPPLLFLLFLLRLFSEPQMANYFIVARPPSRPPDRKDAAS